MSKATPVINPTPNKPIVTNPVYNIGDKVYFTVNGVQCPYVIGATQESNGAVLFVITPDITDKSASWPAGVGVALRKNVTAAQLSDRTV